MTGSRTPDPADGAPRRRRGAPAAIPGGREGEPRSGSARSPERGATTSASPAPQLPGAGDSSPAGVPTPRAGGTPAGSTALSGEEWRKEVKRVTSAQHAEARRRAGRYVPRSRKGVQGATGPGMVRKMPPPRPPEDAA